MFFCSNVVFVDIGAASLMVTALAAAFGKQTVVFVCRLFWGVLRGEFLHILGLAACFVFCRADVPLTELAALKGQAALKRHYRCPGAQGACILLIVLIVCLYISVMAELRRIRSKSRTKLAVCFFFVVARKPGYYTEEEP